MQDSVQTPASIWIVVPGTYEKWIDHARGKKFYKAIFRNTTLGRRVSGTNFKTASEALAFQKKFTLKVCKRRVAHADPGS